MAFFSSLMGAICRYGVPQTEKANGYLLAIAAADIRRTHFLVAFEAAYLGDRGQRQISHAARGLHEHTRFETFRTIVPVGSPRITMEFLVGAKPDEPFMRNESDEHANREGPATEAEAADFGIAGRVVAADELVQVDDVTLESPAERAAEQREILVDDVPTPSSYMTYWPGAV